MEEKQEKKITNRDAPEGEAYSSELLPDGPKATERRPGQQSEDIFGKRISIGMTIPTSALEDMAAYHGLDAVDEFVERATGDFKIRLLAAIAETCKGIGEVGKLSDSFDIMQKVYDKTTTDEPKEDAEVPGGVPGYHWSMVSGGVFTDLIRTEAEEGIGGVMRRISEIIGDQS